MVKTVLKTLRRNSTFNFLIRHLLVKTDSYVSKIKKVWPVSGIEDLQVNASAFKLISNGDDPIANALFYARDNYKEINDLIFFQKLAATKKTILDIGANSGIYSVISSKINTKAKIYAFEPYPINYNRLKENITLNTLKNVDAKQVALGAYAGEISFFVPDNDSLTSMSSPNESFSERKINERLNKENKQKIKEIKVPQVTLDAFVKENNIREIDLVKIDVETYEMEVFKGAVESFSEFNPIIFCEIFIDDERQKFFNDFMLSRGFYIYMITSDGLLRLDEGIQRNSSGMNYFFVKYKTNNLYYSFSKQMDELIAELT